MAVVAVIAATVLGGCSEVEIAAISEHSLRNVRSMLDAHY